MISYIEKPAAKARKLSEEDQKAPRVEAVGGLTKGLAIIELFDSNRPRLTVSEAARATGISPAAARRCLLTLESLGYVSHDGKYFRPTPRLARLGTSYDIVSPLAALAQPCLEAVRQELGESSSLAVLDGADSLFIARAESARIVSFGGRVGSRLPAHGSATGRVLLAALPDDELERRLSEIEPEATTPGTLVAVDEIRARILEAREADVAITIEELEIGLSTMAVPVRDSLGRVHGALSMAAASARATEERMRNEFLPVMRREAQRLGAML